MAQALKTLCPCLLDKPFELRTDNATACSSYNSSATSVTALLADAALLVAGRRVAAFSHVVAYPWQTSSLRGTASTLLDAASYGQRRVLLSPDSDPAACVDSDGPGALQQTPSPPRSPVGPGDPPPGGSSQRQPGPNQAEDNRFSISMSSPDQPRLGPRDTTFLMPHSLRATGLNVIAGTANLKSESLATARSRSDRHGVSVIISAGPMAPTGGNDSDTQWTRDSRGASCLPVSPARSQPSPRLFKASGSGLFRVTQPEAASGRPCHGSRSWWL